MQGFLPPFVDCNFAPRRLNLDRNKLAEEISPQRMRNEVKERRLAGARRQTSPLLTICLDEGDQEDSKSLKQPAHGTGLWIKRVGRTHLE